VLGPVTPLADVEPKRWEDAFAINVTANWRMIWSLDPLLRTVESAMLVCSRDRAELAQLVERSLENEAAAILSTARALGTGGVLRDQRTGDGHIRSRPSQKTRGRAAGRFHSLDRAGPESRNKLTIG
jgi:NAD(P)-dependent dehydrogenase (short-subunit alcohol dehydrogenase family)